MNRNAFQRILSLFLAALMLFYGLIPSKVQAVSVFPTAETEPASTETVISPELEQFLNEQMASEPTYQEPVFDTPVYQDGVILLYSYEQLCLVGSGALLCAGDAGADTIGQGDVVRCDDGLALTYSLDAAYALVCAIELPAGTSWQLPMDFAGTIEPQEEAQDKPLYDADTNTVYLYHPYQLAILTASDAADQPVLTGDVSAETFGIGQPVLDENGQIVTYGQLHTYALSPQFSSSTPAMLAAEEPEEPQDPGQVPAVAAEQSTNKVPGTDPYGRDFPGQVIKKINGETYILIGNEAQLRAIGTDEEVFTAVYQTDLKVGQGYLLDYQEVDGKEIPIVLYGGDADLLESQNGYDTFAFHDVQDINKDLSKDPSVGSGARYQAGVNQETGEVYSDVDNNTGIGSWKTGEKYSKTANYIIFRDIDLGASENTEQVTANWTPLYFEGNMIGATVENSNEQLWSADSTSINTTHPATISNIRVVQNTNRNYGERMGVGFFSTISSPVTGDAFNSDDAAVVQNLVLSNITVINEAERVDDTSTLVSILIDAVVLVLGGLLDGLLIVLSLGTRNPDLSGALETALSTRKTADDFYATGAFAGRLEGLVEIKDCTVENVKVSNVGDHTGGFVGHTEGSSRYALGALNELTDFLARLLDNIPYLGLGDLITLLTNLLPVANLIVIGYVSPTVTGCTVRNLQAPIGATDVKYVGGFVGYATGTWFEDCRVLGDLTVTVQEFGGGFVGVARDGELNGTLSGLLGDNITIKKSQLFLTQSILMGCSVGDGEGAVNISGGSHLGGFAGALANSYAIDATLSGTTLDVKGTGSNVGGAVGRATLGWLVRLGQGDSNDKSLLTTVVSVLETILSSQSATQRRALLSLAGISPSAIMGCQMNYSGGITVFAKEGNAGGLLGVGDGVTISSSTTENVKTLPFWEEEEQKTEETESAQGTENSQAGDETDEEVVVNTPPETDGRNNVIVGLRSVKSGTENVGGVVGQVGTASFAGLLDGVLGLGSLIGFRVADVQVTGMFGWVEEDSTEEATEDTPEVSRVLVTGYTVQASGNYAGGAFGYAIGGEISNVVLDDILRVEAYNYAGGFAGCAGPGDLAGDGGINLSLLGISILKLNNLLSVGEGVEVQIRSCRVNGFSDNSPDTQDGFTVEALGRNWKDDTIKYVAAGFLAKSNSTEIYDSHVTKLYSVKASVAEVPEEQPTEPTAPSEPTEPSEATEPDSTESTHPADQKIEKGEYTRDEPVPGGYAGGFVGTSETGGLAEVVSEGKELVELLKVQDGLLKAVAYMIPEYKSCTVAYVDGGYVEADVAGGFAGDIQSGYVNPEPDEDDPEGYDPEDDGYAVYNISRVKGNTYAGGFAGLIRSGALASAGGGISILGDLTNVSIDLTDLLSVVEAYVPFVRYAGINAPKGFTVEAAQVDETDLNAGSAGGFAGYISGGQISYCNVTNLAYTEVSEHPEPTTDEAKEHFKNSSYAVLGGRYAGGYVGHMDIGNAASLGGGLQILGKTVQVSNLLEALSVVTSTIEHSQVTGSAGGFAVMARAEDPEKHILPDLTYDNGEPEMLGSAGGFAGQITGGHIQDSHVHNFSHIVGQISAGGYVGTMVPGSVASVIKNSSVLGDVIDIKDLANLLNDFVPTIRNSSTDCIPCGGTVRADAASTWNHQRGMAGGYVGYNQGGHIWGLNNDTWQDENDGKVGNVQYDNNKVGSYVGNQSLCRAVRIGHVFGEEYAGGFAGMMESSSTANAGSISILSGLITVDNLLGVLQVAYPTQENTEVSGPLTDIDEAVWKQWLQFVGLGGNRGRQIANTVVQGYDSQAVAAMCQQLEDGACGYGVAVGRESYDSYMPTPGADAGGYVGRMTSGVITNAQVYKLRRVTAAASAGGFAGRMLTGGAASVGSISIAGEKGITLNLDNLLKLGQFFVPVVKSTTIRGDQAGLIVAATGENATFGFGYAGGFVGAAQGAQILGDEAMDSYENTVADPGYQSPYDPTVPTGCKVYGLLSVQGEIASGGFVGQATSGSLAQVNTNASNGMVQSLLDALISDAGNLVTLLDATLTKIHQAELTPANPQWGFTVGSAASDYSGGFVGMMEAAVIGDKDGKSTISITGLRQVDGIRYAGGFLGLADVSGVATVGSGKTTLLSGLIGLGETSVLDAFRPYVYYASVEGIADGFRVNATMLDLAESGSQGVLDSKRYQGCAGGFGGGLMNGSVKNCSATNLDCVIGPNYVGGFIGHLGRSGVVDVDGVNILDSSSIKGLSEGLLSLNAGVLDVFGSHVEDCTLAGIAGGYLVHARAGAQPIAGGFAGYADLARMKGNKATNAKQITSDEIAGGFMGTATFAYLVNVQAGNSALVDALLEVVKLLVEALYIDDIQNLRLLTITLPGNLSHLITVKVGGENLVYVELLGIRITASLDKHDVNNQDDDVVTVTLGDSSIKLKTKNGKLVDGEGEKISVSLFKANRTKAEDCSITGIADGYDVYGGGMTNDSDASAFRASGQGVGYAGGFVGYNDEGKFVGCATYYCDAVRGLDGQVGPFSGTTGLDSVYDFNDLDSIEGYEDGKYNTYRIYRDLNATVDKAYAGTSQIADVSTDPKTGLLYVEVRHLYPVENYAQLQSATLVNSAQGGQEPIPLLSKRSGAVAVLMEDTPTEENPDSLVPEPQSLADACSSVPAALTINKVWRDWDDVDELRPDDLKIKVYRLVWDTNGQPYLENGVQKRDHYATVYLSDDLDVQRVVLAEQFAGAPSAQGEQDPQDTPVAAEGQDPGQIPPDQTSEEEYLPIEDHSAVWSLTLEDLLFVQMNADGTYTYYTYELEEEPVYGYSTAYTINASDNVVTMTNTHIPELDNTGGMGDWLFVGVGVGLLMLSGAFRKRRGITTQTREEADTP